jgi:hypothetical protein
MLATHSTASSSAMAPKIIFIQRLLVMFENLFTFAKVIRKMIKTRD